MGKRDLNRLVKVIARNLQTPEGKASLEKARRDAQAFIEELRQKRRVPWWTLWERITI